MKVLLVIGILTVTISVATPQLGNAGKLFGLGGNICDRDVTQEFRLALYDFTVRLYKRTAYYNNDHFSMSQISIWLALSALAEGAEKETQEKMFKALNLPKEPCIRQKYYKIATSLETPGNNVTFNRKRLLVLDEGLKLNTTWATAVKAAGLIDTITVPLKAKPEEAGKVIRETISAKVSTVPSGNSIVIDSLDYEGMWTTAFPNSSIEHDTAFFNDNGEKIGTVDLLKIKKRVKLAHYPLLNAKALELPVGNNGRYRLILLMNIGKTSIRQTIENLPNTIIIDIVANFKESLIPLDIAIPMFTTTSEFTNVRQFISEIGAGIVFGDPAASKYVSEPPALPSEVIQRVTLKIGDSGLEAPPEPTPSSPLASFANLATGVAAAVGHDFIANRPFLYCLVDMDTRTCLVTGAFSIPTKK